jgi:hypothetical protein
VTVPEQDAAKPRDRADAQPMGEDDGERGERNPTDAAETARAADQVDRLETNSTSARDSQGLSSREPTAGAGREADVPHGESGDAG